METKNRKKIYRDKDDYIVAGVCSGIAEYFEIDSTLIRVIFILLTIGGGSGVLIYLILWLIIPKEGGKEMKVDREKNVKEFTDDVSEKAQSIAKEIKREVKSEKRGSGSLLGLILVILGMVILAKKLLPMDIDWEYVWTGILIFLGFYLMVRK